MDEAKKAALMQVLALTKDARVNKLKKKKKSAIPGLPPAAALPVPGEEPV